MRERLSWRDTVWIGFMLFALFFGAGNLVFPPMLGQAAGTNVWLANLGFLTTGVGLPLICVMAIGYSGKPDLMSLASRVHSIFGVVYTTVLYLTIGPLFAMPRTGSVAFEITFKPFLSEASEPILLFIMTILFFAVSCLCSLNPSRIIDIVGKMLTPALLLFLLLLAIAVIAQPLGPLQPPQSSYAEQAFYNGFQEGYLTMDALAAFVFGIIVIDAIKARGAASNKRILFACLKATLLSATILGLIYSVLSYIGASSTAALGMQENGAAILTKVSDAYFGTYGSIVLGGIVLLACLTTSIGLTTSCSAYLHRLIPAVSYRTYAVGLSVFSAALANFGLSELISISVPVLTILYPLAIVLAVLTFLHPLFRGKRPVYIGSLLLTFLLSLIHVIGQAELPTYGIHDYLTAHLPLYKQGLGWTLPAAAGALLGLMLTWTGIGSRPQD